jgi:hypothetical protein
VESVEEAAAVVRDVARFDRRRCRAVFEARFAAERMARDYVDIYRKLLCQSASQQATLAS